MKYLIMAFGCSTLVALSVLVLMIESRMLRYPVLRGAVIAGGHVGVMVVVYSVMIWMEGLA